MVSPTQISAVIVCVNTPRISELILLAGSTGTLGFRILIEPFERGHRVRAAVRNQGGIDKLKSHHLVSPYLGQLEFIIVPDITVNGAYDEAVKGVTAVIHVASPLPKPGITAFETQLIQPAVRGTTEMLASAMKTNTILRILITLSIDSIVPAEKLLKGDNTTVYNERSICPFPGSSFSNALEAYLGSKAIAFRAVTEAESFLQGTNRIAFGQLLGQVSPHALPSTAAYLKDIAKAHILSLDSSIHENQNFVIHSDGLHGTTWGDAIDIVKDKYSENFIQVAGFKLDAGKTSTVRVSIDSSYSQRILGFEFQPYKEQVLSVFEHYLELLELKEGN